MAEPFSRIKPKEIEQLDDKELVRLLDRLLHCEARDLGLQETARILVPTQTNVPDGGRDGLWKADIGRHKFIPRSVTFYQCKAAHITGAICRDEVVHEVKDKTTRKKTLAVKPRVSEVLSADGCYAFFCGKHEIKPSEATDLDTVTIKALKDANFKPSKNSCVEFYGSNRIAEWVNRFPAAVRFVREITRDLGGVHYFTVEHWSKLGRVAGPFFQNSVVTAKIQLIRDVLVNDKKKIIRFIGSSGLGKSRLAHQVFSADQTSSVSLRSLSASTIYISYGDMPNDTISFVTKLADNDYSSIVVVDDCPPNVHDRLVDVVTNSPLSLLTIFHQSEPPRGDTYLLSLEPSDMEDVVEQILRADPHLSARSNEDIRAVAAFAQGFPQIAKLIAEFRRAPTLEELRHREPLFQKLIGRGEEPDSNTIGVMQALSLFRTVGGGAQILGDHLEKIRQIFCNDIAESQFLRVVQQQRDRKVVQQIADTLMVVPRPLAVALAADYILLLPVERWKTIADKLQVAGLLPSFSLRLGELEYSEKGQEIGRYLLEQGFPFTNAEYLLTGKTGPEIFRALAVLNPKVAIETATNALDDCSMEVLRDAQESRRYLVRAFEFASWEEDTFLEAARLLLRLSAAENEGWANNATGAFRQLFHLHLSGTKLPAIQRLEVLREALETEDEPIRSAAIAAIGSGLNFNNFSRMSDVTLGGKRDARLDWSPSNRREELDYWIECYQLLQQLILNRDRDAEQAKNVLSKNIGALLQIPLLDELDQSFELLCKSMGNSWPDVRVSITRVLDLYDNLSPEYRSSLERWLSYVSPAAQTIENRLTSIVSRPGWRSKKGADGHYIDLSQQNAEALARELSKVDADLIPCVPQLLVGEQQQALSFGVILGAESTQVAGLIGAALDIWPLLDVTARTASFLSGIMRGLGKGDDLRRGTLECVASDPALIDLLVPLSASLELTNEDFLRVCHAVEQGLLEPSRLRNLIQGQPMQALEDEFILEQFRRLLLAKPAAAQFLFEVLWLHCHGVPGKFDRFAPFFRELLLQKDLPVHDSHFGWEWHEAAIQLVRTTDDKPWLVRLCEYIRDSLFARKTWVSSDYLRDVTDKLFQKIPVDAWATFARALRAGDDLQKYVLADFLGSSGSKFDNTVSPLWTLPEGEFRSWAQMNRDLIPVILDKMSLYTVEQQRDGSEKFVWHPYARILLEEGKDDKELKAEVAGNLLSFGSTGSRVPYLEKRLDLVRELAADPKPKLKRIGKALSKWLEKSIDVTQRRELNENARFS